MYFNFHCTWLGWEITNLRNKKKENRINSGQNHRKAFDLRVYLSSAQLSCLKDQFKVREKPSHAVSSQNTDTHQNMKQTPVVPVCVCDYRGTGSDSANTHKHCKITLQLWEPIWIFSYFHHLLNFSPNQEGTFESSGGDVHVLHNCYDCNLCHALGLFLVFTFHIFLFRLIKHKKKTDFIVFYSREHRNEYNPAPLGSKAVLQYKTCEQIIVSRSHHKQYVTLTFWNMLQT